MTSDRRQRRWSTTCADEQLRRRLASFGDPAPRPGTGTAGRLGGTVDRPAARRPWAMPTRCVSRRTSTGPGRRATRLRAEHDDGLPLEVVEAVAGLQDLAITLAPDDAAHAGRRSRTSRRRCPPRSTPRPTVPISSPTPSVCAAGSASTCRPRRITVFDRWVCAGAAALGRGGGGAHPSPRRARITPTRRKRP